MPYQQLEELQSRRREKVAKFLTAEQLFAMMFLVVPVFIGTASFGFWVRGLLLVAAGILGLVLTLETDGMPLYGRLLWRIRGMFRLMMVGRLITPQHLAGTISEQGDRPLPINSPIRLIREEDLQARRRTTLVQHAPPRDEAAARIDTHQVDDTTARTNGHAHAHV